MNRDHVNITCETGCPILAKQGWGTENLQRYRKTLADKPPVALEFAMLTISVMHAGAFGLGMAPEFVMPPKHENPDQTFGCI